MTPTQFEDRLLSELCQVVAARPSSGVIAAPRRRRAPRLLLGGAATAAVAAVLLVVAGGDQVTPAFAIDRQPDGNVTVTINRLSDAAGLERQLRAAGIAAIVNYTPLGKACREPRGRPAPAPTAPTGASVSGSSVTGHATSFTVSRNTIGSGQTLVISTSGGEGASSVAMQVIQGPVSPCELVGAPAPPPAPARSFSTDGASQATSRGTKSRALHTGQ